MRILLEFILVGYIVYVSSYSIPPSFPSSSSSFLRKSSLQISSFNLKDDLAPIESSLRNELTQKKVNLERVDALMESALQSSSSRQKQSFRHVNNCLLLFITSSSSSIDYANSNMNSKSEENSAQIGVRNNRSHWDRVKSYLILAQKNHIPLNSAVKSKALKCAVQSKANISDLILLNKLLFQDSSSLPDAFSFENYLRLTFSSHPKRTCQSFGQYILQVEKNSTGKAIHLAVPTAPSFVYLFKAISSLLLQNVSMAEISTYFTPSSTTISSNSSSISSHSSGESSILKTPLLMRLFNFAVTYQKLSIGNIVTCIMAMKEAKDFAGLHAVYVKSKLLAKEGSSSGVPEDKLLPSIVYGQVVVSLAKLGAESLTYQVICDMLEAGKPLGSF